MYRSLLTALLIYGIGCIIPTPLEAEQSAANRPPRITGSEIEQGDPIFGQFTTKGKDEFFQFSVIAKDDDEQDSLRARIYWQDGSRPLPLADDRVLLPTRADPTVRQGSFSKLPYCQFMDVGDRFVEVFVTDGEFKSTTAKPPDILTDPTRHTFDSQYWVIKCR